VREKSVLSQEEAIRKLTSLPAQRAGFQDRGLLREGMWADIVIFDPETVSDAATFEDPHQYSRGIRTVLVNGEFVLEAGQPTGARPGQILRHRPVQ
jgi:N-acyl-D-aspartate/D-glutamate deacylase